MTAREKGVKSLTCCDLCLQEKCGQTYQSWRRQILSQWANNPHQEQQRHDPYAPSQVIQDSAYQKYIGFKINTPQLNILRTPK